MPYRAFQTVMNAAKTSSSNAFAWLSAGVSGGGVVLAQAVPPDHYATGYATILMSLIAFLTFVVKGILEDRIAGRAHSEYVMNLIHDVADLRADNAIQSTVIQTYKKVCDRQNCPFSETGRPACLDPTEAAKIEAKAKIAETMSAVSRYQNRAGLRLPKPSLDAAGAILSIPPDESDPQVPTSAAPEPR